ncbi:hypothetical protein PSAC2689_90254 [Paraburkholderia sacchari]
MPWRHIVSFVEDCRQSNPRKLRGEKKCGPAFEGPHSLFKPDCRAKEILDYQRRSEVVSVNVRGVITVFALGAHSALLLHVKPRYALPVSRLRFRW